ncbi:MAG: GNAT family N-acetyltransferase [bacterium]|nr:GNAT family N-acetyltransferase [bacterium]
MIHYRRMEFSEKQSIAEIDRSERVTQKYVSKDGELELVEVDWDIGRWSTDGSGPHSIRAMLEEWSLYLQGDSVLWGAFDEERLVGFIVYRPNLAPRMGQLALLFISKAYRRRGVGQQLFQLLTEYARNDGVESLYVTATPTRGTVDFYQSLGFCLTDQPLPEMLEMEPEDIHMTMEVAVFPRASTPGARDGD